MSPTPPLFQSILTNLEKVIHGKTKVLETFLIGYFAGGHILLEDVPGVGKTTLAKALACSIQATYHRVQFTPDLLPADIIGGMIYHPKTGKFNFHPGPVFTDLLLADEINRTSPRTQSALLEAMNEWQVSVDGKPMPLPQVFTVIATQNPISFHGTYPLPEAQLDRFYIRVTLGYPNREDEILMLKSQQIQHPLQQLQPVADVTMILSARQEIRNVTVEDRVLHFLMEIVERSRHDARLKLGISPRGTLAFYRIAQANAWSKGRDFVTPDDLKEMAYIVLAHRIIPELKMQQAGIVATVIQDILNQIPIPAI